MKFYHGTTRPLSILRANSWLTEIATHALGQAEKRSQEQGGAPFVLIVEVGEGDTRPVDESDRNDENRGNDFSAEPWMVKSTRDLPVLETLDYDQAKAQFLGAKNLLPPV
jgi:hypothetical protein